MSVALFRIAISATNDISGLPVLVIGYENGHYLIIDDGGQTLFIDYGKVTFDWRYDWRNHHWIDVGEMHDQQTTAPDDRSAPVSRFVPEPDRADNSDPLDPQGPETPGDPRRVDPGEA